ncbi:hypothetical protein [Geoalkalibacter subterraneus]|uniref:Uncharacterized protein n=1 Tax=Geoalkalibacter subterraneus TaxID=483547 RepID=A0A0B5FVW0_9BACT|nr:hypothetical protein [Geoalkalibacter subterraneus]AJF08280.1 hypothetical protein GSUB_17540 [Geoalkalibacter subterraneus]
MVEQSAGAIKPFIVVTHADPLIENPEMALHARREMERIKAYAARYDLDVRIEVATPALGSQWVVKVLGGRALPVFANKSQRDCTVDLKVVPQERLAKKVLAQLDGEIAPVTVVGTRFDESAGRKSRMEGRGEVAGLWQDEKGRMVLSLVADWLDADIWGYLKACNKGEQEAFSDFGNLIRLYRDASRETRTQNGCEVYKCRFGCSVCTVGRDHSLEKLLETDPERYGYMGELLRLQKYLVNTQYDFSSRTWIGRTINNGYITITPDVYSPQMCERLLQICLTIDVREKEKAAQLGIEPRFELVSAQALIAIDALWSLQGLWGGHRALRIFRDIYYRGERYEIPETQKPQTLKMPSKRYLYVGDGWLEPGNEYQFCGLRDVVLESLDENSQCMGVRTLKDGRVVMQANEGPLFEVDEEAAGYVFGFELDHLIDDFGKEQVVTAAYRRYVGLGTLTLAKGAQAGIVDNILRRTTFKERVGLCEGAFDLKDLLKKTVSKKEMEDQLAAQSDSSGEEIEREAKRHVAILPKSGNPARQVQLDLWGEASGF